jgi:hypothetical protein
MQTCVRIFPCPENRLFQMGGVMLRRTFYSWKRFLFLEELSIPSDHVVDLE